jgi:ubiquinone/menaquinone biosynthesis C-methylase UbiE
MIDEKDKWDNTWMKELNCNPYRLNTEIMKHKNTLIQLKEQEIELNNIRVQLDRKENFLECGIGSGVFSIALSKVKKVKSFGIDFSRNSIKLVKSNCKKHGTKTHTVLGDMKHMPFKSNSFNSVYSGGVNEHFIGCERQIILREMLRVSKNLVWVGVPYHWAPFYRIGLFIKKILLEKKFKKELNERKDQIEKIEKQVKKLKKMFNNKLSKKKKEKQQIKKEIEERLQENEVYIKEKEGEIAEIWGNQNKKLKEVFKQELRNLRKVRKEIKKEAEKRLKEKEKRIKEIKERKKEVEKLKKRLKKEEKDKMKMERGLVAKFITEIPYSKSEFLAIIKNLDPVCGIKFTHEGFLRSIFWFFEDRIEIFRRISNKLACIKTPLDFLGIGLTVYIFKKVI